MFVSETVRTKTACGSYIYVAGSGARFLDRGPAFISFTASKEESSEAPNWLPMRWCASSLTVIPKAVLRTSTGSSRLTTGLRAYSAGPGPMVRATTLQQRG